MLVPSIIDAKYNPTKMQNPLAIPRFVESSTPKITHSILRRPVLVKTTRAAERWSLDVLRLDAATKLEQLLSVQQRVEISNELLRPGGRFA
jgi:hypothetical protein